MNYEINGDFGEVRHLHIPLGTCDMNVPFPVTGAGWHRCNDQYLIHREYGFDKGHMLLFSISPGGIIKLGDKEAVSLPASSITWISSKQKHSYYTETGKIWEFYWLDIEDTPCMQLEQIFRNQTYLSISHPENISREFELMLSEKKKNPNEFQISISQRVSSLYHMLLQESHLGSIGNTKGDALVHNIIRYMESDCSRDWNLPQLSNQYYISVPQLIRRFKAETGLTPYAYLMNIRLHAAETYLKHTKLSVDEISHKTGFSSTSNFIMQFRNYYGTTPQKYRGNV